MTTDREELLRTRTALQKQVSTLKQVMEPMERTPEGRAQMPAHWVLELKRYEESIKAIDDELAARDDDVTPLPTPADFEALRASMPPRSPVDPFVRPLRTGFGFRRLRPRRAGILRHILRRVTFYAITIGEIALDELKQFQMNLDVSADDLDPGPDPTRWQFSPNVMDDYPELERDDEKNPAPPDNLYGGVFGRGGIGR